MKKMDSVTEYLRLLLRLAALKVEGAILRLENRLLQWANRRMEREIEKARRE